jgi:hypothetical protein
MVSCGVACATFGSVPAEPDATAPLDAAAETDTGTTIGPDGDVLCPTPLQHLVFDGFEDAASPLWQVVSEGDASAVVEGGVLVARVPGAPPGNAWGFFDIPFMGNATAAQVSFKMTIAGTSPNAHVGCKLVFGELGSGNDNINARIVTKNGKLDLEIAATDAGTTGVVRMLNNATPAPGETLSVVMTMSKSPGAGYKTSTIVGDSAEAGGYVETTVPYQPAVAPMNGSVRCGIMQTTRDAGAPITVTIDDVSAIVCP